MKFTKKSPIRRFLASFLVFLCLLSAAPYTVHAQNPAPAEYPVAAMEPAQAEYPVAAIEPATLYAGSGAELFASPDPLTVYGRISSGRTVLVTGISGMFFQVNLDGQICYMYGQALSTIPGTRAYLLTAIDAREALVGDTADDSFFYGLDIYTPVPPASTTKIMTALLVLEAIARGELSLDTPIQASAASLGGLPSDASHVTPKIKSGEVLTVRQLLECVMIKSDCYACNILAIAVAGSVPNFVARMNSRAAELGCINTNFVNTSGYPEKNHYSNAYSLYLITKQALLYPVFEEIVSSAKITIPATNLCAERSLVNTNELLSKGSPYYNADVFGVKTGSCKSAGLCLVAAAHINGHTVITVILGGSKNTMTDGSNVKLQFYETNRLFEIAKSAIPPLQ